MFADTLSRSEPLTFRMYSFVCNICDSPCNALVLDRELPSCNKCGSNVRFRWIVHALAMEVFGESLPLKQFTRRKMIRGLGMSDALPVAEALAKHFDYKNTCYDRRPQFDIMAPPSGEKFDFIVAS